VQPPAAAPMIPWTHAKAEKIGGQDRMISYRQLLPSMLNRIQNRDCGPIGINLTRERLHLLQLEKKKKRFRIRANVSKPYPAGRAEMLASPPEFSIFVHEALRSGPFKGRDVVSCLPAKGTKMINLSYQMQSGINEDEAVVGEVMNCINGNLTDYVIDYLPIRT
jgi:Tfp pilus assembly PilM family ATPase